MDINQVTEAMKDPAKMEELCKAMVANATVIADEFGETMKVVRLGDMTIPLAMLTREDGRRYKDIRQMKLRRDDVVLISYPKTGTHWMFNLLHFLMQTGPLDDIVSSGPLLTELFTEDEIEAIPSPRILATHEKPRMVPEDIFKKGCKIVLVFRNPKDTATSMFHHLRKDKIAGEYKLSWNGFIESWMKGEHPPTDFFDYYNDWQRFLIDNRDANVLIVHFEDLKKNGMDELRRIQAHLGLKHSDERLQQILDRCSINRLKADVADGKVKTLFRDEKGESTLYRQGSIGDWKNHFTVAQSEQLDAIIRQKFKDNIFKLHS